MNRLFQGAVLGLALILAFGAIAEVTVEEDAEFVTRGWFRRNGKAFGNFGAVQKVLSEKDGQGDVLWYVVVMDGGAVVVSPDTEIEPVLAVIPGCDGTIPEGSPLRAILKRDLTQRLEAVRPRPVKMAKLAAAPQPQAVSAAAPSPEAAKWQSLKKIGGKRLLMGLSADGNPATIIRWLDGWNSPNKVGDVQTLRFWNQDSSPEYFKNSRVFNLYTPNNYVCGCVATAGSAVMHYFRAPSGAVLSRTCGVDGAGRSLTTKGGTYDWSLIDDINLAYGRTVTLPKNAADLLGRVASDCGIGCEMSYSADGSGSNTCKLQWSFRNVFGVSHAQLVTRDGGMYGGGATEDIGSVNYPKIIYNQIRGGAPVPLGIDGHEVVACGYGIDADQTDYTYIFLGWGGANDAWYALPNIDTKATAGGGWYTSTFIDELITEISFDDRYIPVVGRIVDIDGIPLPGEQLEMANGEVVTSDANGYWGTRVAPTDECYVTDSIGERHEYVLGDLAKSTTDGGVASAALAAALPEAMEIQLLNPAVIVYDGETAVSTNGSMDRAVEAAARLANPRLEIVDSTVLRKPCVIDFNCTICATNDDPVLTPVLVSADACLTIATNALVWFSNVVFQSRSEGGCVLNVAKGGKAVLADAAALDGIKVADDISLELAGVVNRPMLVDAPGVTDGASFAVWTCDQSVAEACAYFFLNLHDDELGGIATADGHLVWGNAPVPEAAVAVRLTQGDEPVSYRSFAALLNHYLTDRDAAIEVCKDCKLNEVIRIADGRSLSLSGPSHTVTVSGDAGFEVVEAAKMVVSNLTLTGKLEGSLFAVGEQLVSTGNLVFGDGAVATNVVSRSETGGGVVCVYGGSLRMEEGSLMTGCSAARDKASGGAVYLGPRTVFDLAGGVISNCYAATTGGGVFAYPATINLSGSSAVVGNASGENSTDNIFFAYTEHYPIALNLTGRLTGENGSVGIRFDVQTGGPFGEEGEAFANIGDGVSPADAEASAPFLLNDAAPGDLVAAVSGEQLVWALNPFGPGGCEPSQAAVRVVYPDGVTNWYAHVATAVDNLRGACDLELLTNDEFAGELSIAYAVTLRSAPESGEIFVLERTDTGRIGVSAGGSLTVEDVCVSGVKISDESFSGTGWGNLIAVDGGELVLKSGAVVGYAFTDPEGTEPDRAGNAVTVYNGGCLTMESGSCVISCGNDYFDNPADVNSGVGGGILIDTESTAYFQGGLVTVCYASRGGGVAIANKSTVYVSGDFTVTNNVDLADADNNFVTEDLSSLVLADDFTGCIGIAEGIDCDTNVFGKVDAEYYGRASLASLTNGAANFHHDVRGVHGVVATNGTDTALLVWSDAFDDSGDVPSYTYVDENGVEHTYWAMGELPAPDPGPVPPEIVDPYPIAFTSIEKTDAEWVLVATNARRWCWYSLWSGTNLKTNEYEVVKVGGQLLSNQWNQADGPITNRVPVVESEPVRFWIIRGASGEVPAP